MNVSNGAGSLASSFRTLGDTPSGHAALAGLSPVSIFSASGVVTVRSSVVWYLVLSAFNLPMSLNCSMCMNYDFPSLQALLNWMLSSCALDLGSVTRRPLALRRGIREDDLCCCLQFSVAPEPLHARLAIFFIMCWGEKFANVIPVCPLVVGISCLVV